MLLWVATVLLASMALAQDTRDPRYIGNTQIYDRLAFVEEQNHRQEQLIIVLQSTTTQQNADINRLEVRFTQLESTTTQQTAENNRLDGRITQIEEATSQAIGFAVYPSASRTYSEDDRVVFDRVITNLGGGYSTDTNQFRCPVKGLYLFTVSLTQEYTMSNAATCSIRLQGNRIGGALAASDDKDDYGNGESDQGSSSTVVECNTNEIVYVELSSSDGGDLYGGSPFTMFSGVLITPL